MAEVGEYRLKASDGNWCDICIVLVLKADGKASYKNLDVADRDTHSEDNWEGVYKVEGDVLTFYGDKVKHDHCYDYAKEFTAAEFSQQFKMLPDGNLNELDKDGSLKTSYSFGYGSSTDIHVLTKSR